MNGLRPAATALVCLVLSTVSYGSSPKIAPDLGGRDPASIVNVIVQFAPATAGAQQAFLAASGGTIVADLPLIEAVVVALPAAALEGVARNPNVLYISPDRSVTATLDYA